MQKTKFTPGPWKQGFKATSDFDGEDKKGRPICKKHTVWQAIESSRGSRVATAGIYVHAQNKPTQRITAEEAEANARLIAAAPEMYEALYEALVLIEDEREVLEKSFLPAPNTSEADLLTTYKQATKAIKAALAKVEGK